MQGERWSVLSPLLDELLDLEGDERTARLSQIAADDPTLADELVKMLALETERPDFLSEPVTDARLFSPQPDHEIGPYRLVSPLGEGGMGQVWLAVRADGLYERRVALKLLRPGLGDPGLHARFTRERQILARLGHAHIARLLDAGISRDGQPYLALDYVRGEPITTYAQTNHLSINARLGLFAQVCAAVSHAHANLIVHRDLKPSNILVTPAGEVCLLDFGIAKLLDQDKSDPAEITHTGSRTFTLHYAAPEQLRGEVITTMTDVYALGVVLYELLTDLKPYIPARQSDAAWEEAILIQEPQRPSLAMARKAKETHLAFDRRRGHLLAGDLDNIIVKALSKIPEQRYASVEAFAQDLQRHIEGKPVLARPLGLGYRWMKFLRRNTLSVSLSTGMVVLLVIALITVSWQARKTSDETMRAQALQNFMLALFENAGSEGSSQDLNLRSLLDASTLRAANELAAQPLAHAQLLEMIARIRSDLGDDEDALRLLDKQQHLISQLGDAAPHELMMMSATLRGHSLLALERPRDCVTAMLPIQNTVIADMAAYTLPSSDFLSQLGRCRVSLGDRITAQTLFEQALSLRRAQGANSALLAESENDLAQLQIDKGQGDTAATTLQTALTHLRASGDERNVLGIRIWSNIGLAAELRHAVAEAEAAHRQALDIALGRLGLGNRITAQTQYRLAKFLIDAGKYTQAEPLLHLALDSMHDNSGPSLAQMLSLSATLALKQERIDDADLALAHAIALWKRIGDLPHHAEDVCRLAHVRRTLGKLKQAQALDQQCFALRSSAKSADASVPK